ncbi:MAG: molybdopterin molybdotransferase MoeA [Candidatus Acidiferrales bacterium]
MLSYEVARAKVIEVVRAIADAAASRGPDAADSKHLSTAERIDVAVDPPRALGRILAESINADRNYPPFDRSARDGYAIRAVDAAKPGARLRVIGESRAGFPFTGRFEDDSCVRIMTGAPVPEGADAIVMQEQTRTDGYSVIFEQVAQAEQNIIRKGTEMRLGSLALSKGMRLGYAELAIAAQVGCTRLAVNRKPRVAILSTGDEVVGVEATPGPFQIRNSNSVSLAAQVALAGGEPVMLGNAPDDIGQLRAQIERGLAHDILVLSGGVSVGKYDLVEPVLRELDAEFFFDAIAIRPGKPAVFSVCGGKPVFGLPGNPVSTMVTFELLVVPAIELFGGAAAQALPLMKARLRAAVEQKAKLMHFLPARVSWPAGEAVVEALVWQGSGDIFTLAQGNCFLVVYESKLKVDAGEWVDILPRRGML